MHIVQITDCHLFADSSAVMAGINTEQSLLKVLDAISENESPDMLLVTGDIAQDEEAPTYRRFKNVLDRLGLEYYCLPGNHDQPLHLKEIFQDKFIDEFRHFTRSGWQLILLSTLIPGAVHGGLDKRQLASLSTAMQQHREPAAIFMHHQPVPIQCPWMDEISLRNPEGFFDILRATPSAKTVFFGHVHQEFEMRRDGTAFYGTPSTCFQFKPRSLAVEYDESLPAYRTIELGTNGELKTRVERVAI